MIADSTTGDIPESEEDDYVEPQEQLETSTQMEIEDGFEGYEPNRSDAMALQAATPRKRGCDGFAATSDPSFTQYSSWRGRCEFIITT
eukprot:1157583-Amphidinium_carterae.3